MLESISTVLSLPAMIQEDEGAELAQRMKALMTGKEKSFIHLYVNEEAGFGAVFQPRKYQT